MKRANVWSMGVGLVLASACGGPPDEGTLVEPAPGVDGIPGGPKGTSASRAVPISGGTLTIANGLTAIAADPDRDRVFVVDLATEAVTDIALEEGDEPGRSVVDDAGHAHVVLRSGGAIATVNLESRTLASRRAVCAAPRGIDFDAATGLLHVACDTGELVSMPASGGAPSRVLDLGRDLRDVIVSDGQLWVTRFRTAELLRVDADGTVANSVQPPASAPGSTTPAFQPGVAWRAIAAPGGRIAVVHQRSNPGDISIGSAGYYQTSDPCSGAIVHGTVSFVDTEPDATSGLEAPPLAIPHLVGPSDVAISDDGTQVAVSSVGNSWPGSTRQTRSVLVSAFGQLSNVAPCEEVGAGNAFVGEVTSVAFDGQGRVVAQSREPAQLQIGGGAIIPLSTESRADTGTALFHMNSGFGISCASCHPEGREDGRVWSFVGVGLRRTQSFAGGLIRTAPFHWAGDMKDVPELVREVLSSRMGGPQPNRLQIEHFAGWLDRIPAPAPRVVDRAAAARGEDLFQTAGCSGCHAGDLLTDNKTYDVGTGGEFQVPSLIGVAARAPFIHNGCAPDLEARFGECGGGDAHGARSVLGETQVTDLVAYLESL